MTTTTYRPIKLTSSIENFCDDVEISIRRLAKNPKIGDTCLDTLSCPYLIVPIWDADRLTDAMNNIWKSISINNNKTVFRSSWKVPRFSAHIQGYAVIVEMIPDTMLHWHTSGIRQGLSLLCLNGKFGEATIRRGLRETSNETEVQQSLYEFTKYFDLYMCSVAEKAFNDNYDEFPVPVVCCQDDRSPVSIPKKLISLDTSVWRALMGKSGGDDVAG
jgi:hypothetical protein